VELYPAACRAEAHQFPPKTGGISQKAYQIYSFGEEDVSWPLHNNPFSQDNTAFWSKDAHLWVPLTAVQELDGLTEAADAVLAAAKNETTRPPAVPEGLRMSFFTNLSGCAG
jgi:hypothetical protein